MRKFFITSSGTGVGKTLITTALCQQLREAGKSIYAIKPVISGWEDGEENDTFQILKSLDLTPSQENIESISPYRFKAPLSPDIAAAKECRTIDFDKVKDFCNSFYNFPHPNPLPEREGIRETTPLPKEGVTRVDSPLEGEGLCCNYDYLLIEGVGGVMVPLNNDKTILDLMTALDAEIILVVGSYLGSLSHTLTALETLKTRNLNIASIIISESYESTVSLEDTKGTLKNFTNIPIIILPRLHLRDKKYIWESVPDLLGVLV